MSEFCLVSKLKMDLRLSNVRIPRTFSEKVLNFRLLESIEIRIVVKKVKNGSCYSVTGTINAFPILLIA